MATTQPKTTAAQQQKQQLPPWLQGNLDQYKMNQATVQDLMKKYGFDYTPEYANRIAEAEAQAKRSQYQQQLQQLDNNLKSFQQSLDQQYFLNYMNQAQNQVNRGLNAGIEADQNTRLAMNKQNAMADYMRNDQTARNTLYQQLQNVENEKMLRAQNLYQERLQQAFQNSLALNDRQLNYMQLLAQQDQFNRQLGFDFFKFNNLSANEQAQLKLSEREVALAERRLQEEIRQFDSEMEWRRYEYNNMSAAQRAQLDWERMQFGENMAWEHYKTQKSWDLAMQEAILRSDMTSDDKKAMLREYSSNFWLNQ